MYDEQEQLDVTKLKYVLYARKSTDDPKRQTRSLKDQIRECKKYAKHKKIKIVAILRESQSAKKPEIRSVFKDMLRDINRGIYDGILSWHPFMSTPLLPCSNLVSATSFSVWC